MGSQYGYHDGWISCIAVSTCPRRTVADNCSCNIETREPFEGKVKFAIPTKILPVIANRKNEPICRRQRVFGVNGNGLQIDTDLRYGPKPEPQSPFEEANPTAGGPVLFGGMPIGSQTDLEFTIRTQIRQARPIGKNEPNGGITGTPLGTAGSWVAFSTLTHIRF